MSTKNCHEMLESFFFLLYPLLLKSLKKGEKWTEAIVISENKKHPKQVTSLVWA